MQQARYKSRQLNFSILLHQISTANSTLLHWLSTADGTTSLPANDTLLLIHNLHNTL